MFCEQDYPVHYFGLHPDVVSLCAHPLRQLREWREEASRAGEPAVLKSASFLPFRDIFPFNTARAIELSYRYSRPSLRKALMDQAGPDIIWAARPGASALKRMFPQARLVMQVVDYYPAFRGPAVAELEARDYALADHVLVTGDALKHYVHVELGVPEEKVTVLGQGVHVSKYGGALQRPADVPETSGPTATWVGVLSKSDTVLMRCAAHQLQAMGGLLLLIGPACHEAQALAKDFPCVQLIGSRHPDEVPAYLVHSDIGLMLYDRGRQAVYRGQNPLKLYEYAAAGLTILSTPHDEFQYLDPPVRICRSEQDVTGAIREVSGDRDSARAREFARAHDWGTVFDRARSVIDRVAMPPGG